MEGACGRRLIQPGLSLLCPLLPIQRKRLITHLLIVDDEKHFRTMLVRALKSQGYRATAIDDAYALASAVAIHRPDVVLLDLLFETGTSGLEMCRSLRTCSSVPLIIVSVSLDQT